MLATKGRLEHVTKSKVGLEKKRTQISISWCIKKTELKLLSVNFLCWLITLADFQLCSDYQYLLTLDVCEHSEHTDAV